MSIVSGQPEEPSKWQTKYSKCRRRLWTVNIILLILHYSQVEIRAGGELRGEDGGDF